MVETTESREDEFTRKPQHAWNDPDGDGHDCADCPKVSLWKCDRLAHIRSAYDVFTPEEREQIARDLDEGARQRRRGAASASQIPLAGLRSTSRDSEVREAIEALTTYPGVTWQWPGPGMEQRVVVDRAAVLAILDRSSAGIVQPRPEAAPTPAWWRNRGEDPPVSPEEAKARIAALPASEAAPVVLPGDDWDPSRVPNVAELDDILRARLPFKVVYAIRPTGDPFTGWARMMLREAAPVVGLSEAWAKAEAALPEGWRIYEVIARSPEEWRATAVPTPHTVRDGNGSTWLGKSFYGPTPTEALLNLAARLTQTRTLGEAE